MHVDLFPLVCLHLITWVCCSCSGWPGACQDSTVCGVVLGSCSWRSCRGSAPGRRALTSLAAALLNPPQVQPCAAGSPVRFTALLWLLLARTLPVLFSLGQGIMSLSLINTCGPGLLKASRNLSMCFGTAL